MCPIDCSYKQRPPSLARQPLSAHFQQLWLLTPCPYAELLHGTTTAQRAWGAVFGIVLPTALLALSAFLVVKHLALVVRLRVSLLCG